MATTPPPDVPAFANAPVGLVDYLRRLSGWARQEMDLKLAQNQAAPGLLVMTPDKTKVFKIEVDNSGAITATPVPLGRQGPTP
jgi:hypothetical protein